MELEKIFRLGLKLRQLGLVSIENVPVKIKSELRGIYGPNTQKIAFIGSYVITHFAILESYNLIFVFSLPFLGKPNILLFRTRTHFLYKGSSTSKSSPYFAITSFLLEGSVVTQLVNVQYGGIKNV
ncbi:MAG: hypothetical protein ACFE9R_11300 [Candidatus Hermodarchaeota archaeon]